MHEHIRFFSDNPVYGSKEVIVDLLLAQVHPRLRVETGKRGKAEMGICDMNELHCIKELVGV